EGPNPEQQRQDYNNMRNIAQPNQQNNNQPNQQNNNQPNQQGNHQNADKNQLKNMFGLNDQEVDEYRQTGKVPHKKGNQPNQQQNPPGQNPPGQNPPQNNNILPKNEEKKGDKFNLADDDDDDEDF
ncbi:MAG: hypothetical protein IJM14_07735, partial [Lachnospiraceae bacterium]|nr:hypothetical protein [Lachnospiraceae bacterium]